MRVQTMRHKKIQAGLLTATAFCLMTTGLAAQAQTPPATSTLGRAGNHFRAAQAAKVLTHLNLRSTAVSYHQPETQIVLSAGVETPLDAATTITCPADTANNCTFEAAQKVQYGQRGSDGYVSVCFKVDGVQVSCPADSISASTHWNFIAFTHVAYPVRVGTHTVQSFITSDVDAARAMYTIDYRVYKPN